MGVVSCTRSWAARVAKWMICISLLTQIASAQSLIPAAAQPHGEPTWRIPDNPFSTGNSAADRDPFGRQTVHAPHLFARLEPQIEHAALEDACATSSTLGNPSAGGRIASAACDPYMTPQQERRLIELLQSLDDTDWNGIRYTDLTGYLSQRMPLWLDRRELDIAGIAM